MRKLTRGAAMAIAAAIVGTAPAARADQIDGDWCNSAGNRKLFVEGRRIITPAGERVDGLYTRHSFDYLAPTGDLEAGKHVSMRQVNDNLMLFLPEGAREPEVWTRCPKPIA